MYILKHLLHILHIQVTQVQPARYAESDICINSSFTFTTSYSSEIVSASEIGCSNEEIINMSKIIVKGKITKLLGEYEYTHEDPEIGEDLHSKRYLHDFEMNDRNDVNGKFSDDDKSEVYKELIY